MKDLLEIVEWSDRLAHLVSIVYFFLALPSVVETVVLISKLKA
jgi:hypothetical protein